jgi:hypothetical protein
MGFEDWIVTLVTAIPGAFVMVGAWLAITERGRRRRRKEQAEADFLRGFEEGKEAGNVLGRREALLEMEKVMVEKDVSYREAAFVLQEKCSACGKKCIHYARKNKAALEKAKKQKKKTYPPSWGIKSVHDKARVELGPEDELEPEGPSLRAWESRAGK